MSNPLSVKDVVFVVPGEPYPRGSGWDHAAHDGSGLGFGAWWGSIDKVFYDQEGLAAEDMESEREGLPFEFWRVA